MTEHNMIAKSINGVRDIDGNSPGVLKVTIVGGGLVGLTAAIALRRQGHEIQIFEQSRFADEIGAAIHTTPNATGILEKLGVDPRKSGAVPIMRTRFLTSNDELMQENDNAADAPRWKSRWLMAHRAHLHSQLKATAISEKGEGKPVKLRTSSKVLTVDPQIATITLVDGTSVPADVLIGADGVRSNTRKALIPDAPGPGKGKHNAFRFVLQRKFALEDPETRQFVDSYGSMDLWYGPQHKIVVYSTSHNDLLNFACIHPSEFSETSDDYTKDASKAQLLEIFSSFHPGLIKLLNKVDPADLKIYPLYDMATLPTFINARMALTGDAADPFTPHLAQGGAMALEDGVSLSVMLSRGVTPEEVVERPELYNKARYHRASIIQEYSRLVGGDSVTQKSQQDPLPELKVHEYIDLGFSHDEFDASNQLLREHLCTRPAVQHAVMLLNQVKQALQSCWA